MNAEIVFKNITKKYPKGPEALKGINFEVGKGELFTLLGPNGAGKSTLVKIATTLIRKDSGEFYVGGENPDIDFSNIRRHIGVALQDNELDPSEIAENLLRFQGRLFGLSLGKSRNLCAGSKPLPFGWHLIIWAFPAGTYHTFRHCIGICGFCTGECWAN